MVQGSLMVTTKDLQASMDGLDTAVLNFDVKTYIEEAVDNRCVPILETVRQYDQELQDWKKSFGKFRQHNETEKEKLKVMVKENVLRMEYLNKWTTFDKRYETDMQGVNLDIDKIKNRLEKQDKYNESNSTTTGYLETKLQALAYQLKEADNFLKASIKAMQEQQDKFTFMLNRRCDALDDLTVKLNIMTQNHEVLMTEHTKTIDSFSSGF